MVRLLILVLALAADGGAGWLALSSRVQPTPAAAAPAPAQMPMQEVLVAGSELAQGQLILKESLRWQTWPEQTVTSSYVRKSERPDAVDKLAGLMVRSRFVAGEPIREDKLAPANAGFLSAMLASGKRAVAVRVSAESSAGGFILPGDRVDVLQTQTLNDTQKSKMSRTILRNVAVLAVDQIIDESGKQKSAVIAKTVTLELDSTQAETIIAAEAGGMLSLTLRSVSDNGEIAPPVQQQAREAVRILRGGRSEIVEAQ